MANTSNPIQLSRGAKVSTNFGRRNVAQVQSSRAGMERMNEVFNNFTSQVSNSLNNRAELQQRDDMRVIEAENKDQAAMATTDAITGKKNADLVDDMDYVTAWNETKSSNLAYGMSREWNDFYENEFLTNNPNGDLGQAREEFMKASLGGIEDPQLQAQVYSKFQAQTESKLDTHQQNQFRAARVKETQDITSAFHADVMGGIPVGEAVAKMNAKLSKTLFQSDPSAAPAMITSALSTLVVQNPHMIDQVSAELIESGWASKFPDAFLTFNQRAANALNQQDTLQDVRVFDAIEEEIFKYQTTGEGDPAEMLMKIETSRNVLGNGTRAKQLRQRLIGQMSDRAETGAEIALYKQALQSPDTDSKVLKDNDVFRAVLKERFGAVPIHEIDAVTLGHIVAQQKGATPTAFIDDLLGNLLNGGTNEVKAHALEVLHHFDTASGYSGLADVTNTQAQAFYRMARNKLEAGIDPLEVIHQFEQFEISPEAASLKAQDFEVAMTAEGLTVEEYARDALINTGELKGFFGRLAPGRDNAKKIGPTIIKALTDDALVQWKASGGLMSAKEAIEFAAKDLSGRLSEYEDTLTLTPRGLTPISRSVMNPANGKTEDLRDMWHKDRAWITDPKVIGFGIGPQGSPIDEDELTLYPSKATEFSNGKPFYALGTLSRPMIVRTEGNVAIGDGSVVVNLEDDPDAVIAAANKVKKGVSLLYNPDGFYQLIYLPGFEGQSVTDTIKDGEAAYEAKKAKALRNEVGKYADQLLEHAKATGYVPEHAGLNKSGVIFNTVEEASDFIEDLHKDMIMSEGRRSADRKSIDVDMTYASRVSQFQKRIHGFYRKPKDVDGKKLVGVGFDLNKPRALEVFHEAFGTQQGTELFGSVAEGHTELSESDALLLLNADLVRTERKLDKTLAGRYVEEPQYIALLSLARQYPSVLERIEQAGTSDTALRALFNDPKGTGRQSYSAHETSTQWTLLQTYNKGNPNPIGQEDFYTYFNQMQSYSDIEVQEILDSRSSTSYAGFVGQIPDFPKNIKPMKVHNIDLRTKAAYRIGIEEAAEELGINPLFLATVISYETSGTWDPKQKGVVTEDYGQHKGLIQFGEPQAITDEVDWNNPMTSQLGRNGAIVKYMKRVGLKPGMSLLHVYSAINAGNPYFHNAKDEHNGGTWGTTRDKVLYQMEGHKRKAVWMMTT